MKRSISLLACLIFTALLPLALNAQDNDLKINLNPGGKNRDKAGQRTSFSSHFGFGPTFVSTISKVFDGTYYPEFKPFSSWSSDLGLHVRSRLGGPKSQVGISLGLTWRYLNIETDQGAFTRDMFPGEYRYTDGGGNVDYRNTELNVHTLSIPLLLDFTGKKWGFAAGGFFGWRVGNSSEVDFKDGKLLTDVTVRDEFGLNKTVYGLTAQLGHKRVRLYANYFLSNLFAENEPYDFRITQVGLCFQ